MKTLKTKAIALATAAAIAVGATTPAAAHGGWNWGAFAAGAVVGAFAPRPYYYPTPAYGAYYGAPVFTYPPAWWHYAPTAPIVVAPEPYYVQPDPVIRHVQYGLNMLGYGPLAVDGIAGPATWNAIAGFQANNGLAVDGIAGTGTLAVLDHQLPPPPVARAAPPAPAPVDPKSPAPTTDGVVK